MQSVPLYNKFSYDDSINRDQFLPFGTNISKNSASNVSASNVDDAPLVKKRSTKKKTEEQEANKLNFSIDKYQRFKNQTITKNSLEKNDMV